MLYDSPYKNKSSWGGRQPSLSPQAPTPNYTQPATSSTGFQGWEGRRQGLVDTGMDRYGMNQYATGGAYGPDRILELYRSQLGALPQYQAPSASAGNPYAQSAMDIAARANAIQVGSTISGLQGTRNLNPAALSGIAGSVAQQAAGNVGQAGLQGYQLGMGQQENAAQTNFGASMQDRMGQLGMLNNSLQNNFARAQYGASSLQDSIQEYWRQRNQQQQARQGMWGNVLGKLVGAGAAMIPGMGGIGAGLIGQMGTNAYGAPGGQIPDWPPQPVYR